MNNELHGDEHLADLEEWEIQEFINDYCDAIDCRKDEEKREVIMDHLFDNFIEDDIERVSGKIFSIINSNRGDLSPSHHDIHDCAIARIRQIAEETL